VLRYAVALAWVIAGGALYAAQILSRVAELA
jgi:hypothetical protein